MVSPAAQRQRPPLPPGGWTVYRLAAGGESHSARPCSVGIVLGVARRESRRRFAGPPLLGLDTLLFVNRPRHGYL